MIEKVDLIWRLVTVQVEVDLEEMIPKKFNYKLKILEKVLLLGMIDTLLVKYLVVITEELNYKLEVKLMTAVSVKISNMKFV